MPSFPGAPGAPGIWRRVWCGAADSGVANEAHNRRRAISIFFCFRRGAFGHFTHFFWRFSMGRDVGFWHVRECFRLSCAPSSSRCDASALEFKASRLGCRHYFFRCRCCGAPVMLAGIFDHLNACLPKLQPHSLEASASQFQVWSSIPGSITGA